MGSVLQFILFKMYIYKMPGNERQELVEILNVGDRWYELGAKYMNYSTVDLDKFAKEQYKPGGNLAEMLLSHWGSKNHTVLQLFKKLKKMEHYQAMEVIKGLVPKEYHNLIDYNVSNFGPREHSRYSRPFQQVVLPPVKYTQAGAANGPNIDISMSNGSVFDHLYKRGRGGRPRMTWQERLNIAVGTARSTMEN